MSPLWTSAEIEAATGGRANAAFEVSGVTFDSREVQPGDLFIAMPGTAFDGHKFVAGASRLVLPERSCRSRSMARTCWSTIRQKRSKTSAGHLAIDPPRASSE